jgi:hypothetical protein
MAISSAQWSVLVVLAAVGFLYVNDPSWFQIAVVGLLGKVRIEADTQAAAATAAAGERG